MCAYPSSVAIPNLDVEDGGLTHQLSLRVKDLAQNISRWQRQVSEIPPLKPMSTSWGPPPLMLEIAIAFETTLQCDVIGVVDDDLPPNEHESDDEWDGESDLEVPVDDLEEATALDGLVEDFSLDLNG